MDSAISPTVGPAGIESVTPTSAAAGSPRADRPNAVGSAVSLQAIPSSPPAEVLDEMAHAAEVYESLSAHGRTLHFAYDPASRHTSVEVHDRKGNVVGQMSLAKALDVVAGAPLE